MSYLDVPRLNFSGRFAADPSTIDNNRNDFVLGAPLSNDPTSPNWVLWNPMGSHVFELLECTVRSAVLQDGPASGGDPVIGGQLESVLDKYRYPAKLVDLDTDQQSVSTIWGLVLRITIPDPDDLATALASVTAEMPATAFADMWTRVRGGGAAGIPWFSAVYQSVLTDVCWVNPILSPVLAALHSVSPATLSIRFIVDSYQANSNQANFGKGRVVGTIGPAFPGEPTRFVAGRRLSSAPPSDPATPSPPYGAVPAKWDRVRGKLTLDLGNFVPTLRGTAPTVPADGWPVRPSRIQLALAAPPRVARAAPPHTPFAVASTTPFTARKTLLKATEQGLAAPVGAPQPSGTIVVDRPINFQVTDSPGATAPQSTIIVGPADYETSAGIVDVTIPLDEIASVSNSPLALVDVTDPANPVPAVQEDPTGLYVDVSQLFFRLNPGQCATVTLTALRFGLPAEGVVLPLGLLPQGDPDPNNTPAEALPLPVSVTTGPDGTATVSLTAGDPGSPRSALNIDGQVYFIGGAWMNFGNILPLQGAAVSVLVFSGYTVPAVPSWKEHVGPIFAYYAQVYPYMKTIVDLADRDTVRQHADALSDSLKLPLAHPHHMPVLRDLSDGKRETILRWLADPSGP
jgi:hypothetical protein